jgi:hypothetical protein
MRFQILTFLAIAIASVAAVPQSHVSKRDVVSDPKGNVKMTCKSRSTHSAPYHLRLTNLIVSDETIKLGTIKIDDIIAKLASACSTQGQCDTSKIDLKGQLIAAGRGSSITDETLTIEPSGAYPTWIHNGLIDALSAAVKAVAKCEDVTNTPTCASTMSYCPCKSDVANDG